VLIRELGTSSPQMPGAVANVEWLGCTNKIQFQQTSAALRVQLPPERLSDIASVIKVTLA